MEKVFALLVLCFAICAFSQNIQNSKCAQGGKCNSCGITCEKQTPPCCGNGVCEPEKGESCSTCSEDCGQCATCVGVCGNKLCEVNENGCNCPEDCGPCCCDGQCQFPETFETCPGECGGALSVRTVDAATGLPLPSTNVTCTSRKTATWALTDTSGDLVIGSLRPNDYTCTARLTGYYDNSASHVVTAGGRVFVPTVIPLSQFDLGTLSGLVKHATQGSLLRGAKVNCSTDATNILLTTTDAMGAFHFRNVKAGKYSCQASLKGFALTSMTSVNVAPNTNQNLIFSLTPVPATLQFNVLDLDTNLPISGVNVSCVEGETKNSIQQTNAAGKVTFTSVAADRVSNFYVCSFSAENYATYQTSVHLERSQTLTNKISLRKIQKKI